MAKKNVKKDQITPRPPIVVVMGHIDHGKTTLLDHIRKTKVTEGEHGGITQHVGAYEVEHKDRSITFLDTPGHSAFTNIRKRGAKIADIAILVVAADDKVNEQTVESIEAIKEAEMPFVIAINKTDKENANPEKIKTELSEKDVLIEEWGGKIPSVNISAKTGEGIDELLELVLLATDLEELKTNNSEMASGYVVESHVDKKRGIAATLVIQNGTLKQGMCVTAGDVLAPVRIFESFAGKPIKEASASSPVTIVGFNQLPEAGSKFQSHICKKDAEQSLTKPKANKTPEVFQCIEDGQTIIPIILKTDVIGSREALEKMLKKIEKNNEKIQFKILKSDIGDINEDDLKLAASGDCSAIVVGFNISYSANLKLLAERLEVSVQLFNIIYEAEDYLKEEAQKRTPKVEREEIIGKVKILKLFKDGKNKKIIGGEVVSGKIMLNSEAKIFRKDFQLGEGRITELQHNKDKTSEVKEGNQFGALLQTKTIIAEGDILEIIQKVIE
ncbi:MAG: translation initiation factor IF-2 [Patescibacteria group bacterium]